MSPKYKILYFPITGLAECIRYILSYMGEEFEDVRFGWDEWPEIKPTTPYGKVPVVTIDGKELTQSGAICRYVARQAGLAGDNDWEDLQIDITVDTYADFRIAIGDYYYDPDETARAKKKGALVDVTAPFYLGKFEEIAKENNGYLANGKLSWADLLFVSLGDYLSFTSSVDFYGPSYPTLKALKEKVHSLPGIKEWVEKRPDDIMFVHPQT